MLVRTIVGLSFLGISSVAALAADLPIPMKARAAPAPILDRLLCWW